MSFTSIVKNEASKIELEESEKITELSALIFNLGRFNDDLVISTENASVARRIYNLVKEIYDVSPKITVRRGYNFKKSYLYILTINKKVELILSDLSILEEGKIITPKNYIVADEDLMRAYLRGVFLAIGSINDPKKSRYHLEFLVDSKKYADFLSDLLNQFYLNSKIIKRESKYMVYIKEAEKIGDFLRIIRVSNAVLYYEDIRIYRDHKNMTNRLNNCEQANIDKVIFAATEQLEQINLIKEKDAFDLLDDKVKEVATYRLKYPETSLQELSEIISLETGRPITKSGLHHRLNKIKDLADRLENKKIVK